VQRVAEVAVRFEFAPGAGIIFLDPLEVSLDCPVCRRCHRTVVFREGQAEGICTPTGHAFPGRIVGKQVGRDGRVASVVYRVEYRYEPFTDAKYPDHRKPTGEPTWGRVAFEVACPSCGQSTQASTQTNIVRPWVCRCKCGCVLYTERDEQPALSSAEAPDGEPGAAPDPARM
jgi:hypothetical protein